MMPAQSPQAFDIENLPSQKEERFKYTNIKRALPKQLGEVKREEKLIHIPSGQTGGKPVDILWISSANAHHQPVLQVGIGEGAEATIIETHTGDGAYWKNMTSEITLGKNAKLTHIRIIDDSEDGVLTNNIDIAIDAGAQYNSFTLIKGGKLSRQDIVAAVDGEGAHLDFDGVMLLDGQQHADTTILVEHNVPNSTSSQFFRNVLSDQATGVFQGKVHVLNDAQKTDARQMCKSLLLSERAVMNTKPELEIYADDVQCAHGATTGQIDAMQLFYMRSRGIPEKEARKLLTKAFVQEAVDKILDEEIRVTIENKIDF